MSRPGPLAARPRRPVFGSLPTRGLALRAAGALALGLLPLALQLNAEAFALLYGLQLGVGMVVIGTTVYVRDQRGTGRPLAPRDVAVAAGLVAFGWLAVLLLIAEAWSPGQPVFLSIVAALEHVDGRVAAAGAGLVAWGAHRARRLARRRASPDGSLDRPVTARTLCVVAFVLVGPPACELFCRLGASEPLGVALAYWLSEAYPFLATLADRGLDRLRPV